MEPLTIVVACYGQPLMMQKQLETWGSYPRELQEKLRVIVVDDHGTPPFTCEDETIYDLQIYRVDDSIPWNQMGARNLGMHHARGWCVMIDPDMVIPECTLQRFFKIISTAKRGEFFKFGLKHMDGSHDGINMTSPNTHLIHRSDFFLAGGYDEDYAWHKGWSDVQLQSILTYHFKINARPGLWVEFYGCDRFADAQVVTLDRTVSINRKKWEGKRREGKRLGWGKWVKQRKRPNLRFKWSKVR